MKTKIIALLLALVVMVGMFASCGGGKKNNDDNDNNSNTGGGNTPPVINPDTPSYPWDTTNLIFQMTENSNNQELGSTCKRYLAGNTDDITDYSTVDDLVTARNTAAETATKVKVEYQYLPDTAKYDWGQNIDTIHEEVIANAANAPDIYCNFVYDMVAASLKGSFANLLSTTMYEDGHELAGADHNYFAFADPEYKDTGVGYMNEYMRSLTLSKFKMYCLSSDYFTDMVRAFLVVPVNIAMLEGIAVSNEDGVFNSDRANVYGEAKKDGDFTIEDFYQLVWDKEWTYETLAAFSGAVYAQGQNGGAGEDIHDKLGFALATSSGLSAAGMLYTTSITVIDRVYDAGKGDYTYSYPNTEPSAWDGDKVIAYKATGDHADLNEFCDAITDLFEIDGVVAIGNSAEETGGYGKDALLAIRSRFATGDILFGGVICLGSLEYDEYKEMNGQGKKGYGIVPVPLYRGEYKNAAGESVTDDYLTQIHNIGRVGAISFTTDKFAQCTAYLNYQSLNSTEILNEYYDFKLQYDVIGGNSVKGNVEMLKYIRVNVRSSFDKAYEDALGIFYSESTDGESRNELWHSMIKDEYYIFDSGDMTAAYAEIAIVKAQRLYDLEYITFPALPN